MQNASKTTLLKKIERYVSFIYQMTGALLLSLFVFSCNNSESKFSPPPTKGFAQSPSVFPNSEKREKMVIRTFPDGYRDDRVGSIFSDSLSTFCFYIWHTENGTPFTTNNTKLQLQLPVGLMIDSFGVYRTRKEKEFITVSAIDKVSRLWTLDVGKLSVKQGYKIFAHYPLVPWTTSCIQVYLLPEKGKKAPDDFTVDWKITGDGLSPVSRKMRLKTFSLPSLSKPKKFQVWSGVGPYSNTYDKTVYGELLNMYRSIGVNHLIEMGGCGIPEYYSHKELADLGFVTIKNRSIRTTLTTPPKLLMKKWSVKLEERDYAMNFNGKRTKNKSLMTSIHGGCPNYYCLTRIQDKSSPVFKHMYNIFAKEAEKGFEKFHSDYEHFAFAECYCPLCRREFAKYSRLDATLCETLSPYELTRKYTVEWFEFRTAQMGMVLQLVGDELRKVFPGVEIGMNDNFIDADYYFPDFKSYGTAAWAEDPRILDKYLDYHNADTLLTALGTIYRLDLYFQRDAKGIAFVKKPVVARVSSFLDVDWKYICILGKMDRASGNPKCNGMGGDIRPVMQKLEIANAAALGAKGIELDVIPYSCDVRTAVGAAKGLDYVAEFEMALDFNNRQPWDVVSVYDCTLEPSPYHQIGPKGLYGKRIYTSGKKFGLIQFVSHKYKGEFITSLFNWDFYQEKKIRVSIPKLAKGEYYVNFYRDGEKLFITNSGNKIWSAKEMADGVKLNLPAGAVCAIVVSPFLHRGYKKGIPSETFTNDGKLCRLYTWRRPESDGDMERFKQRAYRFYMKILQKKHKIDQKLQF